LKKTNHRILAERIGSLSKDVKALQCILRQNQFGGMLRVLEIEEGKTEVLGK
jgi:hypothetical protein